MPKDESSTSASSQDIDLNILCKFISKFDGNREKLIPFINNCRNAINLATTNQQDILLKYIISQLEGRAESACSIKLFETWSQLEDFLKSQFGERKHYAALLSDLQECRQTNSETVNQYALRIETCLSKLLTEINISIPTKKKAELAGRVAAMQDLALHTFVIGLNPRLSTVVRCRDPETLNDAINFAMSEEKIFQATRRNLNQTHFYDSNQGRSYNRQPQQRHFAQNRPNFSRPSNNAASAGYRSDSPVCRYCKIPGHTIDVCRKREFNNRQRFGSTQNNNHQSSNAYRNLNQPIHAINIEDQGVDVTDSHLNEEGFPSGIARED